MKLNIYNICLFFIAAIFLLASCSAEDDPFTGTDNYIASFSLKQGNVTYNASVLDKIITLKAPDGISLEGAVATMELSENATVYPDPSTITDWNKDMLFAVTAYSGEQVTYKYTVERSSIETEGSVVLETQSDVDEFGSKDITFVAGNLIIGRTFGTDSITTLAPLAKLKEIGYSLIIYPTYSSTTIAGLDNLEKVGGEIFIENVPNLESVIIPNLKHAGSIYIRNGLIAEINLPDLRHVLDGLTFDAPLKGFSVPNLKAVDGLITFNTASNSNAMMTGISFPALESAGAANFYFFKNVSKVDLPELKKIGSVFFTQFISLSFINAPKLIECTGELTIPSSTYLVEASFPSLEKVQSLTINGKTISHLDFPRLKTVEKKLSIQNAQISDLNGFSSLERIEEEFYLNELSMLKKIDMPSSIQYIRQLSIYNRTSSPMEEINITGKNIGELKVMANNIRSRIIGDEVFKGTLTISSSGASYDNGYPDFPGLIGFHEVDSLSLDGYVSAMDTVRIKGIRKINKGLRIDNNNIIRFSMPDIEEIGGDFYFAGLNQSVDEKLEFPKLKTIGGFFDLAIESTKTRTVSFPALESVGGYFTLYTGYNDDRSLESLLFPKLHMISGKMTLLTNRYTHSYTNRLLKDLDGFSALKNAHAIDITNQLALESYAGLKEVFKSIEEGEWTASGNGYNPTFADLTAGTWVKP
jgi:hypothetical protein